MFRAKGGIDRDSGHEHVAMAIGASCSIRMRPEIVNVRHDKHLYTLCWWLYSREEKTIWATVLFWSDLYVVHDK